MLKKIVIGADHLGKNLKDKINLIAKQRESLSYLQATVVPIM